MIASKARRRESRLLKRAAKGVLIGCDTEYLGPHTLTAQFAVRIGKNLVIQVYRSPAVPDLPDPAAAVASLPAEVRQRFRRVTIRPAKPLEACLSPARVVADLFGLDRVRPAPSDNGRPATDEVRPPSPVRVTLAAHFLRADLHRLFGSGFYRRLFGPASGDRPRVVTGGHRLLGFRETGPGANAFADPVLEYARVAGHLHPVRVRTLDTALPYGNGSLDEFARTFLGVGKGDDVAAADKGRMLKVFRTRPADAYAYAVRDAALTLLVAEAMAEEDRSMYRTLGFRGGDVPRFKPTLGGRASEMIVRAVARHAAGSTTLAARGRPGVASTQKVKRLLAAGAGPALTADRLSRFGRQTGEVHGGLSFSRTPTRFFHAGDGQFRDADLGGCYPAILKKVRLYAGRPVVLEPGSRRMTVREAVAYMCEHAAGPDAWMLKATGDVTAIPNVLIPSTNGALTNANYRSRAAKRRANARRDGTPADWLYEGGKEAGYATLYTGRVEAGVVCHATWLMIQALPEAARREYENLVVDTALFYPKVLVADDPAGYDALVVRLAGDDPPWASWLDLGRLELTTVERLGEEHASLRFPLGELADKLVAFRREARERHGRGSGRELAWKQHANSLYGVLASPHLPANNVVAANVVTATARAVAFAMQLSLNGFQVITDGCTYRRDEVPAGTLAACLAAAPDYPLRRPAPGAVGFLDPATIPADDAGFTRWYRRHAKRFYGVAGADYDRLFTLHEINHKECGGSRAAFDGLCCDGASNYVKLARDGAGWEVLEFKARSFGKAAKAELAPWLVRTYSADRYVGPPPVVRSTGLLSLTAARQVARKAIARLEAERPTPDADPVAVYFPLGLEKRGVKVYQVIKPSAFLYGTPAQREAVVRAVGKFAARNGAGLELLALRRGYDGRHRGSLVDVAEELYGFIRAGGTKVTKKLNLTRSFEGLEGVRKNLVGAVAAAKEDEEARLARRIDVGRLRANARLTGWHVGRDDLTGPGPGGPN